MHVWYICRELVLSDVPGVGLLPQLFSIIMSVSKGSQKPDMPLLSPERTLMSLHRWCDCLPFSCLISADQPSDRPSWRRDQSDHPWGESGAGVQRYCISRQSGRSRMQAAGGRVHPSRAVSWVCGRHWATAHLITVLATCRVFWEVHFTQPWKWRVEEAVPHLQLRS